MFAGKTIELINSAARKAPSGVLVFGLLNGLQFGVGFSRISGVQLGELITESERTVFVIIKNITK